MLTWQSSIEMTMVCDMSSDENVHDFSFTDNGPWSPIHQYGFIKLTLQGTNISPKKIHFESMIFQTSPGGICDPFLEGMHVSQGIPWTKNWPFPLKVMTWMIMLTHPAHGFPCRELAIQIARDVSGLCKDAWFGIFSKGGFW